MTTRPPARHDDPQVDEMEGLPNWWPAKNTIRLIEGHYAPLYRSLLKILKSPRLAAWAILRVVFKPEELDK